MVEVHHRSMLLTRGDQQGGARAAKLFAQHVSSSFRHRARSTHYSHQHLYAWKGQ